MLHPQFSLDLHRLLAIDNFAGGGGASTGIERALGYPVHHAINHDRRALGMHRINHPQTVHHCEDVFEVDPAAIAEGRPVGMAWFSPDCRHFSKAKGGKPVQGRIRGLCLVMLRYAKIKAKVMFMENVEEIQTWGPLVEVVKNGIPGLYPDPLHKGRTWQAFLRILQDGISPDHPDLPEILSVLCGDEEDEKVKDDAVAVAQILAAKALLKPELAAGYGYRCEHRELRACDYGAPTIRKRLFMIARRDGQPIVWPKPSHGNPAIPAFKGSGLKPWRTIAECIDWQLACPSIFLTGAAARAARCKRPLATPTLRRIAKGIERYVLKSKRPFLVSLTHQGGERVESVDAPANTITGANRGEKAVVSPSVVNTANSQTTGRGPNAWSVDEPARTVTSAPGFSLAASELAPFITEHANASNQRNMPVDEPGRTICAQVKGGHLALVGGTVVNTTNGNFDDAPSRAIDPMGPVPTITGSQKFSAACGVLVGAGGPAYSGKPKAVDVPLNAMTTENHTALVSAQLVVNTSGHPGSDVDAPTPTLATGGHQALITGSLVQTGYGERPGQDPRALDPDKPAGTAMAGGCKVGVVAGSMVKLRGMNIGDSVEAPMHTASAGGNHHGLVAVSAIRHFGQSIGQTVDDPAPTVTPGGQGKTGLLAAVMAQHNGGFNETPARSVDEPCSTISATGSQQQLVTACCASYHKSSRDGQPVDRPANTGTTKPRQCLVEQISVSHLTDEQLAGAHRVAAFLREFGVEFEGPFAMVAGHIMVDIGMRMLTPRELFRAQGFPEDYVIDRAWHIDPQTGALTEEALTKEEQIKKCGNSVCPPVAEAIVRANVPEMVIHSALPSPKQTKRRRTLQPALT